MSPSRGLRTIAAVALLPAALAVALHGCREQLTEPAQVQESAAARGKQRLTLSGAGSTANGTLIHLWACHGGTNQQWSLRA